MTFRVIIRTDVIYKDNTSPLCLLFFHDGRKKSVGLGVSVVRSCWDAQAQKVTDDCPDRDDIQFQITAKIKEYEKKIKKLEALEIPVTFEALFETIGKRMDCTVGYYFRQIIDRLEKVEKYGSASKHKVTLALMSQFCSVNMRFDELDLTYLREFEIFLSQKGNVNNSCNYAAFQYCRLYLIEILHQTTTKTSNSHFTTSLYLIEILHQTTTTRRQNRWRYWLYLIEILHQTTTIRRPQDFCEVLYLIEILHQTTTPSAVAFPALLLYLIEILHQTTTAAPSFGRSLGCILLKFYIKPQHPEIDFDPNSVVSYWNSTSNHNNVPYNEIRKALYLIEILHQTTTLARCRRDRPSLYLIEILHQTTTKVVFAITLLRCILLKFYIKPQHFDKDSFCQNVVSYWNSTSNHNLADGSVIPVPLYLIEILHQTTTVDVMSVRDFCCILLKFYIKPQLIVQRKINHWGCILLKFYIKPQLLRRICLASLVVSYWNSTSNHNFVGSVLIFVVLYLIEILHQTTTFSLIALSRSSLYLIEILHQTTTLPALTRNALRCILLKFYIKPQLHQGPFHHALRCILLKFYIKPQLRSETVWRFTRCILLKFYIKPQLWGSFQADAHGCILLKFYIKPQRNRAKVGGVVGCILLKFYIKPQPSRCY